MASNKAHTHVTPAHVFAFFCYSNPTMTDRKEKEESTGGCHSIGESCRVRRYDDSRGMAREPQSGVAILRISVRCVLRSLGTKIGTGNCCRILSGFSRQFGIVKTTCVAQGASTIWASTPFRCLGSVTAMASARRSSTLFGVSCEFVAFPWGIDLRLCASWPRHQQTRQLLTLQSGEQNRA